MSYYDDSSLFVAPNGYKASVLFAQKPMDANGQLAFTRSNDTATRVASNGLIERVRTNQIRNSSMVGASAPSTLPTNWTLNSAGLTFSVIGTGTEDGVTYIEINATGTASSSNARIGFDSATQILGATGQYWTNSFYFKKVSETAAPDSYAMAIFENTSAGTLVVANVGSLPATTSLARYSYTVLTAGGATVARVQPFVRFSLTLGNSYNFTFRIAATQMETGDIATQFIPTTTAAVSVGPVANIPRIDYLGGGCGKLLLEGQRSNLALFSENFDNAAWAKTRATVTANAATSPDGYQNADKLIASVDNNTHILQQSNIPVTAQIYTATVFAKKAEYDTIRLFLANLWSPNPNAVFNLTSKEVVSSASCTAKITELSNDWFRCEITATVNAVAGSNGQFWIYVGNNGNVSLAGDGTSGILIYGAQLEAGSYASSYVNTLAASVTRGADACSKTGISSLIGQTEGTVFIEFNINADASRALFSVDDGSTSNYIAAITLATSQVRVQTRQAGASTNIITSSALSLGRHKIAVAYKSGDYALYIDGVQAGVSTSTAYPVGTLLQFVLNNSSYGNLGDGYSQALLFKTRLPNSELASLTTL